MDFTVQTLGIKLEMEIRFGNKKEQERIKFRSFWLAELRSASPLNTNVTNLLTYSGFSKLTTE